MSARDTLMRLSNLPGLNSTSLHSVLNQVRATSDYNSVGDSSQGRTAYGYRLRSLFRSRTGEFIKGILVPAEGVGRRIRQRYWVCAARKGNFTFGGVCCIVVHQFLLGPRRFSLMQKAES